jgi:molybdopterin converting factor subunit 1
MRVTVQFFARLREVAGRETWTCEVADGASIDDVWRAAVSEHAALEPFSEAISCALNSDFATSTSGVKDGDEVAFLPPVSGGAPPCQ